MIERIPSIEDFAKACLQDGSTAAIDVEKFMQLFDLTQNDLLADAASGRLNTTVQAIENNNVVLDITDVLNWIKATGRMAI